MKLYDEEEMRRKNAKSKRIRNLILVGIIVTTIIIIGLIFLIYYLIYNPNKITIYLNRIENQQFENMFMFKTGEDGNPIMYVPIKETATIFGGYKSNDGEYTTNYQDKDSCYIETENEVVIFNLGASIIYKIDKTSETNASEQQISEMHIDNPIIKENDTLYIDGDGFEKAFNVLVALNLKTKKVSITTLDDLIKVAQKQLEQQEEIELDEKFANQKALTKDMMVVVEGDLKGVKNLETNEDIIGVQYNDITYIEQKSAFLVKKDEKIGIIDSDGQVKITPKYDSLTLIDEENELYMAQQNGYYGVIDENENTKIFFEWNKIGVDVSDYKENGLKSGYVLLGKIIPVLRIVQQQERWMFYTIEESVNQEGKKDIECKLIKDWSFQGVGCITTSSGIVANCMVLRDYNLIVIKNEENYGFFMIDKMTPIAIKYRDVYIGTSSGKKDYYVVNQEGKVFNLVDLLERNGYTKVQN